MAFKQNPRARNDSDEQMDKLARSLIAEAGMAIHSTGTDLHATNWPLPGLVAGI